MTDSNLEPLRAAAKKAVISRVCPDDYDDRYLPDRLRRAVDVTFDIFADRLVEPEKYDEWHEQDCATAEGPPGPFPCDCKLSKGWKVFLLPPEENNGTT